MILFVVLLNLIAGVAVVWNHWGWPGMVAVAGVAALFLWARHVGNNRVERWDR